MHHLQLIETLTESDFTHRAVELLTHRINASITELNACILGLSGGSTPRPVYEMLGRQSIDWNRVSVHLIDERYVPATHQDSNQRLVRDTLLLNAKIPEANLFFPDTSLPLEECIRDYDGKLRALWTDHLTDINVLGMGPDGHIASLFPPVEPHHMDDTELVAHTTTDAFVIHDRITLTLNPIAAANSHVFLLKGADKKRVWEDMMASAEGETRWPGKRIADQEDVTVIGQW
jgi:6-phosphogluconolactonase